MVSAEADRCPSCGRDVRLGEPAVVAARKRAGAGRRAGPAAAYFMPWFGAQGLLLSGQFLSRFLSSPADVQRSSCRAWRTTRASFSSFGPSSIFSRPAAWWRPSWRSRTACAARRTVRLAGAAARCQRGHSAGCPDRRVEPLATSATAEVGPGRSGLARSLWWLGRWSATCSAVESSS